MDVSQALKAIYEAPNEQKALEALAAFEKAYQDLSPTIAQLWRRHWQNIIPIFDYPAS